MYLSKRGGIYYVWYVNEAGRKRKVSTHFRRKAEALKFFRSFKESSQTSARRRIPLSVFSSELLSYVKTNYSATTLPIYRRAMDNLLSFAGDISLSSLSAWHFDQYKTQRLKTISPVTVNIELRALKAAMNIAVRWKLLEKSPFERLQLARLPEKAPAYFSKSDFEKLISIIQEGWLRDIVLFAALTGMRRGEVVNLCWADVDLSRHLAHIQSNPTFKTKTGKRRTVPLSDAAYHLLMQRANSSPCEYVFSLNDSKVMANWVTHKLKRYIRRLDLDDRLRFHSLRHTFASWLVQDGVSLYEVQKLVGHSNIAVTQVYSHLQPEHLHDTVNRINVSLN
ncbi:MAG: site-specific integrase, partial [Ignavibacteria bacterium]|nr:site-specific integrase [Ignavibacteria bacterium]